MCRWCRHAFALKQADDVPFSNGRLVHCPWCDVPLDRENLPPPTNLAGQLSRGNKSAKHELPSLAAGPDELADLADYDARKLADAVVKPGANLIKKGPADCVGEASTLSTGISDLSTTLTGIMDGDSRTDYEAKEDDEAEVGEYIKACAARLTS